MDSPALADLVVTAVNALTGEAAPVVPEPAAPDVIGSGESDEEVWIPPASDCVEFRHDRPCPHCGAVEFHHRTGRCGGCGRRPTATETPEGQSDGATTRRATVSARTEIDKSHWSTRYYRADCPAYNEGLQMVWATHGPDDRADPEPGKTVPCVDESHDRHQVVRISPAEFEAVGADEDDDDD